MSGRRRHCWLLGGALLVAAATTPTGARAAPAGDGPFFVDRAFTVEAEAYPLEPSPGTQDTEVAIRPSATVAKATNPPPAAFARAAATDLGLAEAYFGEQGPSAAADTATEGGEDDVVVDESGTHLEAHVDDAPRALAIAIGSGGGGADAPTGSFSSRSESIGDGDVLVATASAEATDVAIGPFVLGSGRFDAEAHIDGTPDGAGGQGTITTSDATLGGVPIVIDTDGFRIDEEQVPAPLVDEATAAIQELFSPGGFADIRVVQPKVEVADDGTSVRVSGGGVHVFFTNNDPAERYFFGFTMLGGEALVSLGGELGRPTETVSVFTPPPPPPTTTPPVTASPAPAGATPAPPPVTEPAAEPAPVTEIAYDGGREILSLRGLWPGLRWLVLGVVLLWATMGLLQTPVLATTRRRLRSGLDDTADRYLRG